MSRLEYFDDNGLIHPQKNIVSENGILFRAILDNWDRLNNKPFWENEEIHWQKAIALTIIDKNNFDSNPPERGSHFSRDNMLGLYAICKIHDYKKTIKLLPLLVWNGYKWYNPLNWHPNKWAVFLAFKYPILKYNPLIYIMALWSLLPTDYKNTSGKNLWFLTLTVLGIHWPLKLAEKRYKKYSPISSYKLFEYSHQYYFSGALRFNNADNPIREQVSLYYSSDREF